MRYRVHLATIVAQGIALRDEAARLSRWTYRVAVARTLRQCSRCGDPCELGECDGCRDVAAVKQEARREAMVAQGRCRCGRKRDGAHRQCRWCRAKDAELKRANYSERRRAR